jgi:hypothetical protein
MGSHRACWADNHLQITRTEERKKERKNRKKEGRREFIGVCAAGSPLEIEKERGTGGRAQQSNRSS